MGQSKGGGYMKQDVFTPEQLSQIQSQFGQAGGNLNQAAEGYRQFLPGGGGGQAIADQAQQRFQQQTVPSVMNAFGSGAKSSSALNQALAAGASNLNTDIASQIAQMQLGASQGLAGIGQAQNQAGLQPQFAYMQKQQPFWQSAILSALGAGGQLGGAALGRSGGGGQGGFGG